MKKDMLPIKPTYITKKTLFKEKSAANEFYSELRGGYVRKTKRFLIGGLLCLIPMAFFGKNLMDRVIENGRQWDKVEASSDYQKADKVVGILRTTQDRLINLRDNMPSYKINIKYSKSRFLDLQRTDSIVYSLDKMIIRNLTWLDSATQSRNNLPCVRAVNQYRNDTIGGDLKNILGFGLSGVLVTVLLGYSLKNKKNRILMDKSKKA